MTPTLPQALEAIRERGNVNVKKGVKGFISRPVEERFWERVDKRRENECWNWLGNKDRHGYGRIRVGKIGDILTHRLSWILHNGKEFPADKPHGLHTCDNPSCVNPHHIEPGTHKENMRQASERGLMNPWNATKTHCKYGHQWSKENTMHVSGKRVCRECSKRRCREYRARIRALIFAKEET